MPVISFIIPVYNSSPWIKEVVDSIFTQGYERENLEIILIDDKSQDHSLAILEALQAEAANTIKLIKHEHNKGLSVARNSGIKAAQGDIFVFLDSDISLAPGFITETLRIFKNESIKGVVGKTFPAEEVNYDKFQKYLYEAPRGARHLESLSKVPYYYFLYNMASIRSTVVQNTGLFDPDIKEYGGEDTEYAFRMAQQFPEGLYFSPDLKGYHHHYRSLDDALQLYKIYGRVNVPYIIEKHPEMKSIYYYDYLQGPLHKRITGHIIKSTIFRSFLIMLYNIIPGPLCFGIIRLLLAAAMLEGLDSRQ